MVELPEEQRATALKRLAEIGQRRAQLLAEAERLITDLRTAAIEADQVGAKRSRISELAGVSSKTLYRWLADAGVEVRTKKGVG